MHAIAGNEARGALGLSLQRLERACRAARSSGSDSLPRSARWPEIGRFVSPAIAPIRLVDVGTRKDLDLEVVVPVDDLRASTDLE